MSTRVHVLVVEDDEDLRDLFLDTLRAYRFDAEAVEDAPEALAYLDSHPTPRVLIVDLMLPSMSGADLLRAVRKNVRFADVPAFLATASAVSLDQELDELGVVRVFRKPFDLELVVGLLDEIINDRQ
jgi:two-component system, OmpR family, lantibiotic biosynthesis response regulator NisR/SpaR